MDRMGEGDSSHFARPSIIYAVFWILLGVYTVRWIFRTVIEMHIASGLQNAKDNSRCMFPQAIRQRTIRGAPFNP